MVVVQLCEHLLVGVQRLLGAQGLSAQLMGQVKRLQAFEACYCGEHPASRAHASTFSMVDLLMQVACARALASVQQEHVAAVHY